MRDVARYAGVSVGTVSSTLSGRQPVAEDTRQRVLDAVGELGYQPNILAKSLALQRTYTIGVIAYGVGYYGPSQIVAGAEEAAKEAGYFVFLSSIEADALAIGEHVQRLQGWQVDGVIVAVPETTDNGKLALPQSPNGRALPILFTDFSPRPGCLSVFMDQEKGSYLATAHLIGLGHRTVGTITGPLHYRGTQDRLTGWRKALGQSGIAPPDAWIDVGTWSANSGYRGAHALLERVPQLTAIFAHNDQMALGAIHAITERGLRVPRDVAVVGFDNMPEAAHFIPPLTTVHQDVRELGRLAVRTLITHIEDGDKPPTHLSLAPTLVVRESCGGADAGTR
jgi:LacI family transcriptional regulator